MPSTHTSLHYHLVFSTKDRKPWLHIERAARIHEYLGGCVRTAGAVPTEIGGVNDHVHMLVSTGATIRLSDFLRDVKQASSEWVHNALGIAEFRWQEGYGAFTVSASAVSRVREYIQGQAQHHKRTSFQDEYRLLLERHGIAFDERYLW